MEEREDIDPPIVEPIIEYNHELGIARYYGQYRMDDDDQYLDLDREYSPYNPEPYHDYDVQSPTVSSSGFYEFFPNETSNDATSVRTNYDMNEVFDACVDIVNRLNPGDTVSRVMKLREILIESFSRRLEAQNVLENQENQENLNLEVPAPERPISPPLHELNPDDIVVPENREIQENLNLEVPAPERPISPPLHEPNPDDIVVPENRETQENLNLEVPVPERPISPPTVELNPDDIVFPENREIQENLNLEVPAPERQIYPPQHEPNPDDIVVPENRETQENLNLEVPAPERPISPPLHELNPDDIVVPENQEIQENLNLEVPAPERPISPPLRELYSDDVVIPENRETQENSSQEGAAPKILNLFNTNSVQENGEYLDREKKHIWEEDDSLPSIDFDALFKKWRDARNSKKEESVSENINNFSRQFNSNQEASENTDQEEEPVSEEDTSSSPPFDDDSENQETQENVDQDEPAPKRKCTSDERVVPDTDNILNPRSTSDDRVVPDDPAIRPSDQLRDESSVVTDRNSDEVIVLDDTDNEDNIFQDENALDSWYGWSENEDEEENWEDVRRHNESLRRHSDDSIIDLTSNASTEY